LDILKKIAPGNRMNSAKLHFKLRGKTGPDGLIDSRGMNITPKMRFGVQALAGWQFMFSPDSIPSLPIFLAERKSFEMQNALALDCFGPGRRRPLIHHEERTLQENPCRQW